MLSVIVPAFAEGPFIYDSLTQLLEALDDIGVDHEVVVVSDGNTDETVAEASRHTSSLVKVLHYDANRGKGYAIRHGCKHVVGDRVAFIDADMELHPEGIGVLLGLLEAEGWDAVVGSKSHPASQVFYPWLRKCQSLVFKMIVRRLFRLDIADTQTGLKVFRREALDEVMPFVTSEGFAFDLELLVLVNDAGYRVSEGPVRLDYRFATTTGVSAVVDVLRDIGRIVVKRRRLRRSREWASRERHRDPGREPSSTAEP